MRLGNDCISLYGSHQFTDDVGIYKECLRCGAHNYTHRDNPFATGVSINNGIPMMDDQAREENTKRILKQFWPDIEKGSVSINQDMVMEESVPMIDMKKTRQQRRYAKPVNEWKKQIDRCYEMSMAALRAKSERQILALGREEE